MSDLRVSDATDVGKTWVLCALSGKVRVRVLSDLHDDAVGSPSRGVLGSLNEETRTWAPSEL